MATDGTARDADAPTSDTRQGEQDVWDAFFDALAGQTQYCTHATHTKKWGTHALAALWQAEWAGLSTYGTLFCTEERAASFMRRSRRDTRNFLRFFSNGLLEQLCLYS